jgi:drug/metabolite transporter (DMT)-like permease
MSASPSQATALTSTPKAAPMTTLVLACLFATWVVWGSTYLAIKFALESFPPFYGMGTRFLAAGLLLAVFMRWRGAAWPTARQWWHATIIGALMLGGGMGGTAYAEQSVASGLVVAFIAVQPLFTALLMMHWGERPTRFEWVGIAVGLAGVLMLVQGQGFAASPAGLVAIAVAVTLWGLGSAWSQRVFPLAAGPMGFASEMLCGGAVLMMLSWLTGEAPIWPPTTKAAAAWLYLVVFGSLIAFNAYMVLLANTSSSVATSYSYVNPVIAMLLGVSFAGEVVSRWEWLAAGVILVGVVLLFWGKRRRARQAQEVV